MIGVYSRVSDRDQNPAGQEADLQRWLDQNHIPASEVRWFRDKVTGKHTARPQLQKMQGEIHRGAVTTVICWKLDRLSRTMLDGVQLIGDWSKHGVRVVSVTQGIDFSGLTGRLIASVLFAVAEMELAHIHERQAAGIAVAKLEGKYKGRKLGSRKGNPERARELKAKGLKESEIASALNVAERTVFRYLRSE